MGIAHLSGRYAVYLKIRIYEGISSSFHRLRVQYRIVLNLLPGFISKKLVIIPYKIRDGNVAFIGLFIYRLVIIVVDVV